MAYDVFISYRRNGGGELAETIYHELREEGVNVFFDRKELRFVDFKKQLVTNNLRSRVLVVLLSKDALCYERCKNKNDWLRKELELFLKLNKKIIFVKFRDFELPDVLPASLNKVRTRLAKDKDVLLYDKTDFLSKRVLINEIKSRVLENLLEEEKQELKKKYGGGNTENTKVNMHIFDARKEDVKKEKKELLQRTLFLSIYLVILVIICVLFSVFELESHTIARVILLCYTIAIICWKYVIKSNFWIGITVVEYLWIYLGVLIGVALLVLSSSYVFSIVLEIPKLMESMCKYLVFYLSTLLIVLNIYEIVKPLMQFLCISTSVHYIKMVRRKRVFSLSTIRKVIVVVFCMLITEIIELHLMQCIPNYWS